MSPGFQMLIHWALMQIAQAPRMGSQLVRLRLQEREIERQLIAHTPQHDPSGAMMKIRTLAVQRNLRNRQMVCGGPSVDRKSTRLKRKYRGNWYADECRDTE